MFRKLFIYLVILSKYFSRYNLNKLLNQQTKILNEVEIKKSILNIGSSGELEQIVKTIKNTEIISIDIDEDRKPDIVMDATDLKFEDEKFDAIFLMEVLEHVVKPQKAIDEIYRTLKIDGIFVMSSPYIFGIHDKPYDFYRYTKYGLTYLLKNFKDVKIIPRNNYIHTVIVLIARLMKADLKRDKIMGAILFCFILIIYPLLWLLSKSIKSDDITTGYFVIAKK